MERLMSFQLKSKKENNYKKAFNYSINLLSKLPRTEKQLRDKLNNFEYENDIIDEVVFNLKELGYIDDKNYAAEYIYSRAEKDGPYKIKNQLFNKGISKDIVESSFLDWDHKKEKEIAYNLAIKKAKTLDRSFKSKNKVARFLQNRGFSYEIVREIVCEMYSYCEE